MPFNKILSCRMKELPSRTTTTTNVKMARSCRYSVASPLLCCLSIAALLSLGSHLSLHTATKSDDLFVSVSAQASFHTSSSCNYSNSNTHCAIASKGIRRPCELVKDGSTSAWHPINDDEELIRCALSTPQQSSTQEHYYYNHPDRQVAFMFLTREGIPLRPLWEGFFRGHKGLFSIYIHSSSSSSEFREVLPEESVFLRRRIPSKPVEWGRSSMIDAERRLLANALLDPSNEWFLLLSDSCIPLFNFTTVYRYLARSHPLSFVASFDDPKKTGRGRYNKTMYPTVSLREWRKGSQWFAVSRELAVGIVSDVRYYPVFREHCRSPCYMDEHYVPTLVTKLFPEKNSNRSLTWVDWSKGGAHPATFRRRDVSERLLKRMRGESSSSSVFLFGRKFHRSSLGPLMRVAPTVLGFDPYNHKEEDILSALRSFKGLSKEFQHERIVLLDGN